MNEVLSKTLDYIDENIIEKIDMESLTSASNYSAIQIYRLFVNEINTTPMHYVKMRKLYFSAKDLITNNSNIADVAFKYGFESHDVFIRAFKRFYNVTPSDYIKKGMKLPVFYRNNGYSLSGFDMSFCQSIKEGENAKMENWEQHKVGVVILDEIKLIGVKTLHGSGNWVFDIFNDCYDRVFRHAENRKHPNSTNGTYAVSITTELGKCDYFLGVEVENFNNVPDGAEKLVLPKQKCAVIGYEGGLDYFEITNYFYDIWLPKSGNKSAMREDYPFCTVEYYSPNNDTPIYEERIYIPIE